MTKQEAYEKASLQSLSESTSETRMDVIFRAMEIYAAQQSLSDAKPLLDALIEAKKIIKQWHSMGSVPEHIKEEMWQIYDTKSPEMKRINEAINNYHTAKTSTILKQDNKL